MGEKKGRDKSPPVRMGTIPVNKDQSRFILILITPTQIVDSNAVHDHFVILTGCFQRPLEPDGYLFIRVLLIFLCTGHNITSMLRHGELPVIHYRAQGEQLHRLQ